MPVKNKEFDINKILFIATVIGWAVTAGIGINEFRSMRKTLDTMQEQMRQQQELNGKIIMYIEMDTKND